MQNETASFIMHGMKRACESPRAPALEALKKSLLHRAFTGQL
jgi:hypothetical protein